MRSSNFNPRAPRGARLYVVRLLWHFIQFQSTCPARGTTMRCITLTTHYHFNPRAPRGARRLNTPSTVFEIVISIHVPREGHDDNRANSVTNSAGFQSTCPARGTTSDRRCYHNSSSISIHVPREGHDCTGQPPDRQSANFNPRAPRGARHLIFNPAASQKIFQSTCPARGTTHPSKSFVQVSRISIHVPREGHDTTATAKKYLNMLFQSTCPARGTTNANTAYQQYAKISIHVPREGHDCRTTPE